MTNRLLGAAAAALVSALIFSASAAAGGGPSYHVTITNLTNSLNFTPILVASQRRPVPIFELGSPASEELTAVAEGGDTSLLETVLDADHDVVDVQTSAGLLGAGASVTVIVDAKRGARYISLASMLLPTNDGFIALDSVRAPRYGSLTLYIPGYDAGTEPNDEACANIPGPTCGGTPFSPGEDPDDEGYVHIHRGIHGIADLDAAIYDWRNPVARVTITRVGY